MIELVEAAGFDRTSPIMQGVLAYPDGLITTPSEVVKDLLRRAEQRAGRKLLFTRQEPSSRPAAPLRTVGSARGVKQIVRSGSPL
jgi:hypothetical protein